MTAEELYDAPSPRDRLLEIARAAVGLSYSEPTREQYVQALFDDEPNVRAYQMASGMSSCGLFVRACWRKFGLIDLQFPDRLRAPYVPGTVMAHLSEMARDAGAWRSARELDLVQPADAVFLADPEHVLLVESVTRGTEDPGVDVVTSIDGGQRDEAHNWAIRRRVRRVGAGPSLVSSDGSGRAVEGWIDFGAVAAHFGG
jgi:hypothetical protein